MDGAHNVVVRMQLNGRMREAPAHANRLAEASRPCLTPIFLRSDSKLCPGGRPIWARQPFSRALASRFGRPKLLLLRILYLSSSSMLLSGCKPTQARSTFSSMALCLPRALMTGVPSGTTGAYIAIMIPQCSCQDAGRTLCQPDCGCHAQQTGA